MITSFSVPYGFTGIAVALLGSLNPIGIIVSGVLFGGLSAGSLRMEVLTRDVNASVAVVIQALIILFIAGRQMFQFKRRRKLASLTGDQDLDGMEGPEADDPLPLVETSEKAGESL